MIINKSIMKKLIFISLLACFALTLSAQEKKQRSPLQLLTEKINDAPDLKSKLAIYNSEEAMIIRESNKVMEPYLIPSIVDGYIQLGDKKQAYLWLEKMKGALFIYDSAWVKFFNKFSSLKEYHFMEKTLFSSMDTVQQALVDAKNVDPKDFSIYTRRLRYYVQNQFALGNYNMAFDHLHVVFKKFGNFSDTQNYYQYIKALQKIGQKEQAIDVLVALSTSGRGNSKEFQDSKDLLLTSIKGGAELFEQKEEQVRHKQRETFESLVSQSPELYGKNLKDSLANSKVILLSFWGTWCVPCIESHPKLKQIDSTYHDQGLMIWSLASESGQDVQQIKQKVMGSIAQQGLPWLHSILQGHNQRTHPYHAYNIQGYPTKILLSPEGLILGKYSGSIESLALEQDLKEIFKQQ